jgi:hypothetical protein
MNEKLETELRAAFAERAEDIPAFVRERVCRIDYRPRSRALGPRVALGASAALAATGGAVVALAGLGAGTSPAFAGWSATPTAPASGETAGALVRCTSQLAGVHTPQSWIPAVGWKPVLTDTRGPFMAMILRSGPASATCFNGPSFTTIAANSAQVSRASEHVASEHVLKMGSASGAPASSASPPSVSVLGLGGSSSGPITQASQSHRATTGGRPYTLVQGQVLAGVTSATLVLSSGSNVQATVADGSFVAWWPGSADAASARVASGSRVSTQQLTFTAMPAVNPGPTNGSSSTLSSP